MLCIVGSVQCRVVLGEYSVVLGVCSGHSVWSVVWSVVLGVYSVVWCYSVDVGVCSVHSGV